MAFRLNCDAVDQEAKQLLLESVRLVPNFPKPGLQFKDLSHLLASPVAFQAVVDSLVNRYKTRNVTAVAGIECRGFCFAAPVALGLKVPFVPFRKPGKLPCKSVGVDFKLGAGGKSACFGKDRLEMHEDGLVAGSRVLIIDDMLGTGATMHGACELVEMVGGTVEECACVVEICGLSGRERVKRPLFILVEDL